MRNQEDQIADRNEALRAYRAIGDSETSAESLDPAISDSTVQDAPPQLRNPSPERPAVNIASKLTPAVRDVAIQRLPEDLERLLAGVSGDQWSPEAWEKLQPFLMSNAPRFLALWRASRRLREAMDFEEREYGFPFGPEARDFYGDFTWALRNLETTT